MNRSKAAPTVAELGAGESARFQDTYASHLGFVWRCLRSLGVAESTIEDAAQEVFVVVHRRLGEFRGESSLRTWLYGIVRNVAANTRRTEQRKGGLAELDEQLEATHADPSEHVQDAQAAAFVQAFMAGLQEPKRELFLLAFLEEMTMPEVAAILGIPLNTAYSRQRLLKGEFQAALEAREKNA